MVAFSCARATSLVALFLSQLCPDALPLQDEVRSSCIDTPLSLLQTRAHQQASVKDVQTSEGMAPRDLERDLMAANVDASLLEESEKSEAIKIHVHFHKAGGTLMCNLARQAGEVTPMPETLNCNWKNHDGLRASGNQSMFPNCEERRAHYQKLGLTYSQMEREVVAGDFCEGIKYSCLFRDPIDLITSNINYEQTGDYGPGHATGENCSVRVQHIRELVSKGLAAAGNQYDHMPGLVPTSGWKFMDNMQTRLLSGAIDVPPGQLTREHFEIAKSRLAKFHAVATLEDMKDPMRRTRFFKKMGWNIVMEDIPDSNPAEHVEELSNEDKLWLIHLNKYDYELYRHVDNL